MVFRFYDDFECPWIYNWLQLKDFSIIIFECLLYRVYYIRESEAAMLVFHHREPGSDRNLPTHRQPTQLYVVWLFESPLHTYTHFPANFFNLTITYRMDVRPGQGVAHPYYGIMLARPPDKLVAPEDRDLVWTEEMVFFVELTPKYCF
jgi:hypothetical protein